MSTGNTSRFDSQRAGVALINSIVWGRVIGVVAYLLYGSWSLGVVMTTAMVLNLLLAALMGVLIPTDVGAHGARSGLGGWRDDYRGHGQRRLLYLPGSLARSVPALVSWFCLAAPVAGKSRK